MDYPYQATIVGQDTMPEKPKAKWLFLNKLMEQLTPSQAIRLVLPPGQYRDSIDTRWRILCIGKGVIGHTRLIKHGNTSSTIIYLWYDRSKAKGG